MLIKRDCCLTIYQSIFLMLDLLSDVVYSASQQEIDNHLELGREFLARGQLSDALSHYHAAVEGDPNNYLTYFKRGTVYLALGKAKNALMDLDKVLLFKPDFIAARISRGSVHLKQGNYDEAQLDFYNVLQMDPYNAEANDLLHRIQPAVDRKKSAEYYWGNDEYPSAIQLLSEVIEVSPWASDLYELRSQLHIENDDTLAAIADIRSSTKLQSDNTAGYYKLATLLYKLGHATDALKSIRECLKLDPEHTDCFPFYKKIKKVEKFLTEAERYIEEKNYAECIASAEKAFKLERDIQNIIYNVQRILCICYMKEEQSAEAISACTDALNGNQEPNTYCDRAEAYIQTEQYDDAIRDYKKAKDIDQNFERANDGIRKAQKLQQQAERRDYYKILDVKRSATKKEIVKAYRKMAQKWHPDNYITDEKMKKIAEKKFIDIAAAKEVLTDDDKRKIFDNGEDPLDPESRNSQNMHNFHQFNNFHGSPFQFRFHFN